MLNKYRLLHRLLSPSHPIREHVTNLIGALLQQKGKHGVTIAIDWSSSSNHDNNALFYFLNVLYHRQKILLLCKGFEKSAMTQGFTSSSDTEISLDQYYGDVLGMAFGAGDERVLQVHQNENEFQWTCHDTIRAQPSHKFTAATIIYSLFVMLHSIVLRTNSDCLPEDLLLTNPDHKIDHIDDIIMKAQAQTEARFTFVHYEFGPLGQFRGRDRPTTISLSIFDLTASIIDSTICPPQYLKTIHSWAISTRPMNVRQPIVRVFTPGN